MSHFHLKNKFIFWVNFIKPLNYHNCMGRLFYTHNYIVRGRLIDGHLLDNYISTVILFLFTYIFSRFYHQVDLQWYKQITVDELPYTKFCFKKFMLLIINYIYIYFF